MTNTEAISCLENIKKEIEKYAFTTALDMAIASLKRDEIGLTETVKQIHDGVYAEAYEKGRKDAIYEVWNKLVKYKRAIENANYPFNFIQIAFDELREEQLKEKE